MTPYDSGRSDRRAQRTIRILTVEAPRDASPSNNASSLCELLSRLGMRAGLVDAGLGTDPVRLRGLVAMAAQGADYVVVVGGIEDTAALRAALAPAEVQLHAVDLARPGPEDVAMAAAGLWPLGRMMVDGAPLEAAA